MVVDEDYLVRHSKTHDLGYCGERTEFEHFVPAEFVDLEASSMLQLLKDDLYWETVAHLVTKTCPFKEPYNDMIMTVKQSGMQDFWELRVRISFQGSAQNLTFPHYRRLIDIY